MLFDVSLNDEDLPINIGAGVDISIKELAEKIRHIVGYTGSIEWDKSKPDGAPRKLLDSGRIKSLGWKEQTDFDTGLKLTYQWYLDNFT